MCFSSVKCEQQCPILKSQESKHLLQSPAVLWSARGQTTRAEQGN